MAKPKLKTIFICQQCGAESPKWQGHCADCGDWNSFVESVVERAPSNVPSATGDRNGPVRLTRVEADSFHRITTPYDEFNRVLGGGIVPGSLVLIGGEPGAGKSTLMLQIASALAAQGGSVLYVSGEESIQQIKMRADRLDVKPEELYLLAETSLEHILDQVGKLKPAVLIIDSIQTMFTESLDSAAGSIAQVRDCTVKLQRWAKAHHVPTFIVGHVTKEGAIAGPRALEHIVDAVLYLEGERFQSYRLLRGTKNRFGSTHEVGVFEMLGAGLVEVKNPSAAFLAERGTTGSGSAVTVTMEGTRPLLVEIQALTTGTAFGMPRRTANGVDQNRLHLLTAVLTKRVGMSLGTQDIFVNVVGGLKINEPAVDLGVALAIASSYRDVRLDTHLVVVGEVGLGGEIRSVGHLDRRLSEAAKLGFTAALIPAGARLDRLKIEGMRLLRAKSLEGALDLVLGEAADN